MTSCAIDALVVAEAARSKAAFIATSDPDEIAGLAAGCDVTVVQV